MPVKVSLWRSDAVDESLPEESRTLGVFESVQITYNTLKVWPKEMPESYDPHIAVFDGDNGHWILEEDQSVWSDIYFQVEGEN